MSEKNAVTACNRLENGLTIISNWCTKNKLSIDVKKTKLLIVDPLKISQLYPRPKLYGQPLEQVHRYSYLGVSIDDNLNLANFSEKNMGWSNHVSTN